jgi:Zn-finger protein
MFVNGSKRNEQILYRTFHRCFLPSFISFDQAVSEEKLFLFWLADLKNPSLLKPFGQMIRNLVGSIYGRSSVKIANSVPIRYHLTKRFQRKSCFWNRPIRNKNCLWRPCLLTDQNGMSNSHRCFLPSFGSFVEGPLSRLLIPSWSVNKHGHHRRLLFLIGWFKKSFSSKNCLWRPCLLTDQNGMSNSHRCFLPSFGSFGQVVSEEKDFFVQI